MYECHTLKLYPRNVINFNLSQSGSIFEREDKEFEDLQKQMAMTNTQYIGVNESECSLIIKASI